MPERSEYGFATRRWSLELLWFWQNFVRYSTDCLLLSGMKQYISSAAGNRISRLHVHIAPTTVDKCPFARFSSSVSTGGNPATLATSGIRDYQLSACT
jgi:hypothetical protein